MCPVLFPGPEECYRAGLRICWTAPTNGLLLLFRSVDLSLLHLDFSSLLIWRLNDRKYERSTPIDYQLIGIFHLLPYSKSVAKTLALLPDFERFCKFCILLHCGINVVPHSDLYETALGLSEAHIRSPIKILPWQ